MRAAYIDMTDVSNTCPQGLTYTVQSSIRMCTSSHSTGGCTSVNFPTHGVPYTKVCGRAIAYQRGSNDGFDNYHSYGQSSLNDYYVDGLSVTHRYPRSHVWTFAAGLSKGVNNPSHNCPCALYPGSAAPPFIGEDYFCEVGMSQQHNYNSIIDLRRHSSDIYLQASPIQNDGSYVANLLAHVGETSETMVKTNNCRPWIGLF